MSTNTKSLVSLSILVLCTACVPQALPVVEPSPTLITTQTSLAPARPAANSSPTPMATPTLLLPTPIPIFDVVIDNLAIGSQGQLYASGYGNSVQQLPQPQLAQWDGEKWIALDTGFQPEMDALVVDHAGQSYARGYGNSVQQLPQPQLAQWDGEKWIALDTGFQPEMDALVVDHAGQFYA